MSVAEIRSFCLLALPAVALGGERGYCETIQGEYNIKQLMGDAYRACHVMPSSARAQANLGRVLGAGLQWTALSAAAVVWSWPSTKGLRFIRRSAPPWALWLPEIAASFAGTR